MSCHLKNDKQTVMCLGYTKIEKTNYLTMKNKIKIVANFRANLN